LEIIPRALVAEALLVDENSLPEGDLPIDRFATRFLAYLRAGDEDNPPAPDHPDAWTFSLMSALTRAHPALGLAATKAALAAGEAPEDVADIAAGPLEELIVTHGTGLIGEIEALATSAPRFAYALTGVWPQDLKGSLLWARIEAARAGVPGLDDGAPLPPADGLV